MAMRDRGASMPALSRAVRVSARRQGDHVLPGLNGHGRV